MEKFVKGLFALVFAFILYSSYYRQHLFIEYKLESKIYKLLIAKNSNQWQRGLMNLRSKKDLRGAEGMIFLFPNKDYRSFWNENTYLDLNVYWLDGDKVIGKDFLPNILKTNELKIINSPGKVDKVIEIIK